MCLRRTPCGSMTTPAAPLLLLLVELLLVLELVLELVLVEVVCATA